MALTGENNGNERNGDELKKMAAYEQKVWHQASR